MDEKGGCIDVVQSNDDQVCVRASASKRRSKTQEFVRLGVIVALAYLALGLGVNLLRRAHSHGKHLPVTSHVSKMNVPGHMYLTTTSSITSSGFEPSPMVTPRPNAILRRDNMAADTSTSKTSDDDETSEDTDQSLITDSDGTWVIETTQGSTDSPDSQTTQAAASTTTETESLTDSVIISWKTQTSISILTATATATPTSTTKHSTTSTTTSKDTTSSSSKTTLKTTPKPPPPPPPPSTGPTSTTCPYATCATKCPWPTCPAKPTQMETNLCQMIDQCDFDKGGYVPKPDSHGGKCACLCESGYCQDVTQKKLTCPEFNCCHECECFEDNQMAEQRGSGKC